MAAAASQPNLAGAGHILLDGLFGSLPAAGMAWSEQERQAWVNLAQSIFNVVYKKPPED